MIQNIGYKAHVISVANSIGTYLVVLTSLFLFISYQLIICNRFSLEEPWHYAMSSTRHYRLPKKQGKHSSCKLKVSLWSSQSHILHQLFTCNSYLGNLVNVSIDLLTTSVYGAKSDKLFTTIIDLSYPRSFSS